MNVLVKAALVAATLVAVGCTSGAGVSGAGVSGAGVSGAPAGVPRGSVPACTAFGVRAINQHQTVTQMPAACRGLSRAEINLALGRAIYLVAGSGQRKVAWRHRAAVDGARLAKLITALAQSSPSTGPGSSATSGPGGRTGPVDRRPLGLAALVAWLLTVASGGYMLARFVAGGGLRRQLAAGDRTGPAVVLSHFFLASTGLLLWAGYLATSALGVAWAAVALLLPVVGFGMGTLVVWTSGRSGIPPPRRDVRCPARDVRRDVRCPARDVRRGVRCPARDVRRGVRDVQCAGCHVRPSVRDVRPARPGAGG